MTDSERVKKIQRNSEKPIKSAKKKKLKTSLVNSFCTSIVIQGINTLLLF